MPRFIAASSIALALIASAPVCGAELGDISVRSHLGQQLSADIELADLTAADLNELQVRLARPDVFKGANVAMNPALAGLNIAVVKRDSRRVLHLTTLQPVNAELVHIFFELSSGGRQTIRTASLWLTPEPAGAATPRVAAAAAATATTASATATTTTASATATTTAAAVTPISAPAPVPAAGMVADKVLAASSAAAGAASLPAPAKTSPAPARVVPPARPMSSMSPDEETMKAAAERSFAAHTGQAVAPTAVPAPKPSPSSAVATKAATAAPALMPAKLAVAPARPAQACSPEQLEASTRQCAAADASNKALTTKLVDLEGKVRQLQAELAAKPSAAAEHAAGAPAKEAAGTPAEHAAGTSTKEAVRASAEAKPAEAKPAAPPAVAAQAASGKITDARDAHAKVAVPSASAKSASVSADGKIQEPKKMSRPRLISLIAAGSLAFIAVIGVAVHFLRKRRSKGGPLKIWQSFRKKETQEKAEESQEPVLEEETEAPIAVTAQE
ncbi:type IV pilus assembly protein FimV [Pseudoduganella sp. RAF19]|uniref:type IV pilus assembly protein FimV n=1 Tax=Pseudoduganella sp. RAF19 TaxID=3233052 RepID=UPI003F995EF6